MSVEELRRVYDLYDINQDGKISTPELKAVLITFGYHVSDQDLRDIVDDMDSNHNGVIDFPEFGRLIEAYPPKAGGLETLEDFVTAFRALDHDRDGLITGAEIRTAVEAMGMTITDEELQETIEEADANRDGVINYEEFASMLIRRR